MEIYLSSFMFYNSSNVVYLSLIPQHYYKIFFLST